MTKNRWEEILDEFSYPEEDTTYTTRERELAEHIAELEKHINELSEPTPDEFALTQYAYEKKAWMCEETLNHNSTMLLKPFHESVERYQQEVLCNGKDGIASHNLQSDVYVKVVDPRTGDYTWNSVKWIEPLSMMGCGCWKGILIVAEMGD